MCETDIKSILIEKLVKRTARVGVIGLGYVGLPLAIAAVENGFETIGFDTDTKKCQKLANGETYLKHIPKNQITELMNSNRFEATTEFRRLEEADIIVICVPTPLTKHRDPDLSYLTATANEISKFIRKGQMIVLESTTYPGTTIDFLQPKLETSGLRANEDFFVAFSPEREDPGNKEYTTTKIPKIVGADTESARQISEEFYSKIVEEVVVVSNSKTAETVKLTENIFRAVNIALVNELKELCEPMGVDIWEVIEAAKSKPFGYMAFYPGPGLGGHCIPIDPFYLTWKAREYELSTRFIELAGEINSSMPYRVVDKLAKAIDQRFGKGLTGTKILVVGTAYKKNVDDMRESPALKIIDLLQKRGAITDYFDPLVEVIPNTREFPHLNGRRSEEWRDEISSDYQATLIVTDHDNLNYESLLRHSPLLVDTRNACRRAGLESDHLVQA